MLTLGDHWAATYHGHASPWLVWPAITLLRLAGLWARIMVITAVAELAAGRPAPSFSSLAGNSNRKFPEVLWNCIRYSAIVVGGLLLLVIPGVYFSLLYFFIIEATVLNEGHYSSPFVASADITRERGWKLFLPVLIAIGALDWIENSLLTWESFHWLSILLRSILDAVLAAASVVIFTLMYLRLVESREDARAVNQQQSGGGLKALATVGGVLCLIPILTYFALKGWIGNGRQAPDPLKTPRVVQNQPGPQIGVNTGRDSAVIEKRTFLKDDGLGSVMRIQTFGDGRAVVAGRRKAIVTDQSGGALSTIPFEKHGTYIDIVEWSGPGQYHFFNYSFEKEIFLLSTDGKKVWGFATGTLGPNFKGGCRFSSPAPHDLVVGWIRDQGVALVDGSGKEIWRKAGDTAWDFDCADLDGDGRDEILESDGEGQLIIRKATGETSTVKLPDPMDKRFALLDWPTKERKALLMDSAPGKPGERRFRIVGMDGAILSELRAPMSGENTSLKGVSYIGKADEGFVAVLQSHVSWQRANLYIYRMNGELLYQEVLPSGSGAIALLPASGDESDLLVGGEGEVLLYRVRRKLLASASAKLPAASTTAPVRTLPLPGVPSPSPLPAPAPKEQKRAELRITYSVSTARPFKWSRPQTDPLNSGDRWKAQGAPWDAAAKICSSTCQTLHFEKQDGNLVANAWYQPARIADLGQVPLGDIKDADIARLSFASPMKFPVKPGHVYLMEHGTFGYWVMFRLDPASANP